MTSIEEKIRDLENQKWWPNVTPEEQQIYTSNLKYAMEKYPIGSEWWVTEDQSFERCKKGDRVTIFDHYYGKKLTSVMTGKYSSVCVKYLSKEFVPRDPSWL